MQGQEARYRSTQVNIVKINGVISAHATIKAEYLLSVTGQRDGLESRVRLEDSVYNFHTKGTERTAEIVRATDTVKKDLVYRLNAKGKPIRILNLGEIQTRWKQFKADIPRNQRFEIMDDEAKKQFVAAGDAEYSSEQVMLQHSHTNLFNQIVFGQHLTRTHEDFDAEVFETQSHFFPQIKFDVHCELVKEGEEDDVIRYAKAGKPLFVDKSQMIALYEQLYKKQVEFRFTDHIYEFEQRFSVEKGTKVIDKAQVRLNERIKNNMESEVIYELRRVEL